MGSFAECLVPGCWQYSRELALNLLGGGGWVKQVIGVSLWGKRVPVSPLSLTPFSPILMAFYRHLLYICI